MSSNRVKVDWAGDKSRSGYIAKDCRDMAEAIASESVSRILNMCSKDVTSVEDNTKESAVYAGLLPLVHLANIMTDFISNKRKRNSAKDRIYTIYNKALEEYRKCGPCIEINRNMIRASYEAAYIADIVTTEIEIAVDNAKTYRDFEDIAPLACIVEAVSVVITNTCIKENLDERRVEILKQEFALAKADK